MTISRYLIILILCIHCVFAQFDTPEMRGFGAPNRHFGMPNGDAHSHDNFDTEKTEDEAISARMNPLPFIFNPGLRLGVAGLQNIEARSQQGPIANAVFTPILRLLEG